MTSGKRWSNWIREAGRGHIVAILTWGGLLIYLVLKIMELSMDTEYIFFGIGSGELCFLCIGLGAALALTEFFYLFQGKKQDFYYSLPVKKGMIFWSRYIHGVLQFACPLLLTQIICSLFEASRDQEFALYAWSYFVRSTGIFLLVFLIFYHIGMLAIVVSGKVAIAVVMMVVQVFYFQVFIQNVLLGYAKEIFQSYYRIPVLEEVLNALAPGRLAGELAGIHLSEKREVLDYLPSPGLICAALAWVVILLVLAAVVQKMRKPEMTGRAFTSVAAKQVMEGTLSVLTGAVLGEFLMSMLDITAKGMTMTGILVCVCGIAGAVLMHLFIEWIAGTSKVILFKRKKQMLLECVGACMVVAVFLGCRNSFDQFCPEYSQLENMSVNVNGLDMEQSQYRKWTDNSNSFTDYLTEKRLERYTLCDEGMEAGLEWLDGILDGGKAAQANTMAVVCYHMKDGSRHYRKYPIDQEALDAFASVYEAEEYKEKAYPFIETENLSKERLTWTDGVTDTVLKLFGQEKKGFLEAYQKDVSELKMEELKGVLPIGYMKIDSEANGVHQEAVVYSFFKNTCSFLEEHGVDVERTLDDYKIVSIKVQMSETTPQGYTGGTTVHFYDEKDEIAKWAGRLVVEELAIQPLLCPADTSVEVEVEIEDADTSSTVVVRCYGKD